MKIQYQLVATKPDGLKVFWTGTGFSAESELAFHCDSIDFANLSATMERRDHPTWDFKIKECD